jgi:hypothetical protein
MLSLQGREWLRIGRKVHLERVEHARECAIAADPGCQLNKPARFMSPKELVKDVVVDAVRLNQPPDETDDCRFVLWQSFRARAMGDSVERGVGGARTTGSTDVSVPDEGAVELASGSRDRELREAWLDDALAV